MKTTITKFGIVLIIGILFSFNTKAQLTLTCESGNRPTEQAACWGFGATAYTNTVLVIDGSWSLRGNSLTSLSLGACWVKSPWMKMGSGNITFKTRLDGAGNGVSMKRVVVSYVTYDAVAPYNEGTTVRIDSLSFTNFSSTAVQNVSIAIPAAIANDNLHVYKILFSWIGTGGNERAISDDFVIPGTYWSNPSNACAPLPLIQDADGDGVADADDAFPNDQYRAYRTYVPVVNHFSTLAFEDCWPYKGDYDMNDVVVDYNYEIVTNAQNKIVEIFYNLKFRATGASYDNGFGFELTGINPNAIRTVTGTIPGTISQIGVNGTENGQTNATIIVAGSIADVLTPTPGHWTVNTVVGEPFVAPVTLNVKLTFMENGVPGSAGAVGISSLTATSFNPFIMINKTRGKEVHLPDYKPTSLANIALLGTGDDNSIPASNRYYRTKTNLPWAIKTYESFNYPLEKAEITKAYTKLIDWVISNGTAYTDWDTNPAYRNNAYIYSEGKK